SHCSCTPPSSVVWLMRLGFPQAKRHCSSLIHKRTVPFLTSSVSSWARWSRTFSATALLTAVLAVLLTAALLAKSEPPGRPSLRRPPFACRHTANRMRTTNPRIVAVSAFRRIFALIYRGVRCKQEQPVGSWNFIEFNG